MGNYCEVKMQRVRLTADDSTVLNEIKRGFMAEERISNAYYGRKSNIDFIKRIVGWKTLDDAADYFGFKLHRTPRGFLILETVFWDKVDQYRVSQGEQPLGGSRSDKSFKYVSQVFFIALMQYATSDSYINVHSVTYRENYKYRPGDSVDNFIQRQQSYYSKQVPWSQVKPVVVEATSGKVTVVKNADGSATLQFN